MTKFLNIFTLFFCTFIPVCIAQVIPRIGIGPSFYSIEGPNSSSNLYKLSSKSKLNFKSELLFTLTENYFYLNTGFSYSRIQLQPPDITYSLSNNNSTFWNASLSAILKLYPITLEIGGMYGQIPVLEAPTYRYIQFNKVSMPELFIDLTNKLIASQRNLFSIGAGYEFAFKSNQSPLGMNIVNGNGYKVHLDYEIRGMTHFHFSIFTKYLNLISSNGTQNSTDIGGQVTLSWPGRKDLSPTPDEQD